MLWPDRGSERLRSPCCELAIKRKPNHPQDYNSSFCKQVDKPSVVCTHPKRETTLETAVHVSNNTCSEILQFLWARARQVSYEFHLVEASELSFVYYSLALRQSLCWIRDTIT
ncbi:hypothetical protein PoB_000353800 [Plakobranchus ocellatus]|uniref:Uncharacterized protein n=1 Tax=Plakobranchus ocellatus TaxID=259542 RepID=A0AAV3Y495_9GAST|nr:hypothetical protein PoB_000353800 [Plakobranchus ocellatus]